MTQEFYVREEGDILRISRDSFKLTLRIPGVCDRLPVADLKRCNKCIRTMFTPYIYLKYLHDLLDHIETYTVTDTKRYYKVKPIIKKEIEKYE